MFKVSFSVGSIFFSSCFHSKSTKGYAVVAEREKVQELGLCPGWSYEDIARFKQVIGGGVAVFVLRGNVLNTIRVAQVLKEEGWFPGDY